MKMRHFFTIIFAAGIFCFAFSVGAADKKFESFVKNWTPEEVKRALMNNPRFTQKQLDEALFGAVIRTNSAPNVKLLLAAGANPNAEAEPDIPTDPEVVEPAREAYWKPILHAAIFGELDGDWNTFIILANAGADMDCYFGGDTYDPPKLAHFVALHGNDEAVLAMLKRGIDKKEKDFMNDLTPYDYAKKNKQLSDRVRNMLR